MRPNKATKLMKCTYNFIYTRESPWGIAIIKFKRSMKLFLKDMVGLKRDSHNLKVVSQHGNQMKNRI